MCLRSKKQVGSITSAKNGTTETMIPAIKEGGSFAQAMLIFRRVNLGKFMLYGTPEGSIRVANPSGCSSKSLFLIFFLHLDQKCQTC